MLALRGFIWGGTPFVIKMTPFVIKFVLYVLPLILCMYSTYFMVYSAHDVYSVCTLRTPRCAPKVHSQTEYTVLYSAHESTRHSQQSTWRILKYRVHDRVHNTVRIEYTPNFYFYFFGNRQTGSCPPLLRQDTAHATRIVRPY